jgi:hypothetical protein
VPIISSARSLAVLWAFDALHASGATAHVSELRLRLAQAALRLAALVFCFAGSMFLFEFLGNIGTLQDSFLDAEMGGISFHQMCYFVMVTISTIGYGDFSPATLLGRTFLLAVILGGVAFFSFETAQLLSLRALQASGRGAFRPRARRAGGGGARRGGATQQQPHLLVCGGAVAAGGATLAEFLAEVCHPGRAGEEAVPPVVVLCSGEPSGALRALLARRWARHHTTLLSGSPLVPKDLARAAASEADMALVLADLGAADAALEDEETVLAAAALHRMHPGLPLRVLLIRAESRRLAVHAGLPRAAVIAAHDLEPRLCALALRCPGAGALVSNMLRAAPRVRGATAAAAAAAAHAARTSQNGNGNGNAADDDVDDDNAFSSSSYGTPPPPPPPGAPARWLLEYASGAAHSLHGVLLGAPLHGVSFHVAAAALFARHGIILLALMVDGHILLNPARGSDASELRAGGVAFTLARSEEHAAYAVAHPGPLRGAEGADTGADVDVDVEALKASSRAWKTAFHEARHAAHVASAASARAASAARAAGRAAAVAAAAMTLDGMTASGRPPALSGIVHAMLSHARHHARPGSPPRTEATPAVALRRRSTAGAPAAQAQPEAPPAASPPPPPPLPPLLEPAAFSPSARVDAVAERGGHTVLVSLDARPRAWAAVEGVAEALRQPFLPDGGGAPIVLLCAAPPPPALAARFGARFGPHALLAVDAGAGAAAGDVAATDWGAVLLRAGVDTAARVLYLAGDDASSAAAGDSSAASSSTGAAMRADRRAVLFATVLETHRAEWGGRDVFAAVQLHDPHSVWHLRQSLPPQHAVAAVAAGGMSVRGDALARMLAAPEGSSSVHAAPRSQQVDSPPPPPPPLLSPLAAGGGASFAARARAHSRAAAAAAAAAATVLRGSEPVLHARFAAGRVLLRTDVARLFAAAVFTPGAIELAAALADPTGERQGSMLWRVPLDEAPKLMTRQPSGVNGGGGAAPASVRTFGELLARCAAEGALALALHRPHPGGLAAGVAPGGADSASASRFATSAQHHHHHHQQQQHGLPYVCTCPPPWTRLRRGDALLALAPPAWARAHAGEYAGDARAGAARRVQAAWRDARARVGAAAAAAAAAAAPLSYAPPPIRAHAAKAAEVVQEEAEEEARRARAAAADVAGDACARLGGAAAEGGSPAEAA